MAIHRSPLHRALLKRAKAAGDAEKAVAQQAYMKSSMPYLGLTAAELRSIAAEVFRERPLPDAAAWQSEVLGLWRTARYREERYAALQLAHFKPYREWLTPAAWEMLDECTVTGAWWDFIDTLAPNHYAQLLREHRAVVRPRLVAYGKDDNMWRRRVAILCQLKAKEATDTRLLFGALRASLDHREFFVRKAIGWALRAHSRIDPDAVIDFVERYADRLSPLSKREAYKQLLRDGVVAGVPG